MRWTTNSLLGVLLLTGILETHAQIDLTNRQLIQLGYNQPLVGRGPLAGYAFYYLNRPHYHWTNVTLRLAVAPIYVDSEVGFSELLGPHTDLGVGVAGGGFAESYSEVRRGEYLRGESFDGHDAEVSANLYHRLNPGRDIPLYLILRNHFQYVIYESNSDTDDRFVVPEDQPMYLVRGGVRWGGSEPLMLPPVAMELSAWYEGHFRMAPEHYGYGHDRRVESASHLYWGRALLVYTTEKRGWQYNASLTLGGSANADRLSAYRLGGFLPLVSEFPLPLPGYYFQEISATRVGLLKVGLSIPVDSAKRWSVVFNGATARVIYLEGLEQPGHWLSGVGAGLIYRSPSDAWQVLASYGYGIDAMRSHGRGGHSVGLMVQFDLDRARSSLLSPGEHISTSRGLLRLFQ